MNCKPGDLAIIVRAMCPENVGRIVEVLPQSEMGCFGLEWNTRGRGPVIVLSRLTGLIVGSYVADDGWVPDAWLRPVTGLPITDDVEDEVTA
ncbi:hypothetical protein LGN12_18925 [Burkholderia multivorans]|uniref:hypothetical protein n=1 Tax=Burkholderia multivorans TaxID=87883 RepID=UPI001C22493B|nr:hypothetical protein [Burkholderia multivorans]MBU9649374.1 hypothetical protein [Burkholderia multivorans]MCA8249238.1 hypothetical protein [Burkholderia multivorans]